MTSSNTFTVAVASRALFDLEDEHAAFVAGGAGAYAALQEMRMGLPLRPGPAFGLFDGLSRLNAHDLHTPPLNLVIVSRNYPESGLRFLDAARAHGIGARRAIMTGGRCPAAYLEAIGADLFLTRTPEDGLAAARAGVPAAVLADNCPYVPFDGEIRIAFDGDAVLFDDVSERAYESGGYAGWCLHEAENDHLPLGRGPICRFAEKLSAVRAQAEAAGAPVRLALVTARDGDARGRALRTLREWGVAVDEAYFLGDTPKASVLRAFRPHLFLDDRGHHVAGVSSLAPSALVPRLVPPHVAAGATAA